MGKRRVVLASDQNLDYAFFAPLTCRAWAEHGYAPLLILAGEREQWFSEPCLMAVVEHCTETGADIIFTGNLPKKHRTATIAQVSRLFASFITIISDDDYLIASDIDMFPIGPWVGGNVDESKDVQLFFANASGGAVWNGTPCFTMCYIGMKAATWRKVIGGEGPSSFNERLNAALETCAAMPDRPNGSVHTNGIPMHIWSFDEALFDERISSWTGYPERCQMIPRDLSKHGERRIDRGSWEDVGSIDGYADAHLLRPGHTPDVWPKISHLFSLICPLRREWADNYYQQFMSALS